MEFGLCCKFEEEPIRFRTTTATHLLRLGVEERAAKLAMLCGENATALQVALHYCADHGIGAFRINSQILPLKTHGEAGYALEALPGGEELVAAFRACGELAAALGVRTSFHPDQFVVLSSPREEVVASSVEELSYQAMVAEWVGADVINVHGGGGYGDKPAALRRLVGVIETLPVGVRERLTLENDDRTYTPRDLLPVCREVGVPLVYDVHHHRCNPDGMSVEEATALALGTWNRQPLFHLSSPREGWDGPRPSRHHDYIDPADVPVGWWELAITVDIEAKAKEKAVARLAGLGRG
jgi:UV DNA damage endonuclease